MKSIQLVILSSFLLIFGQKAFSQTNFQSQHKAWMMDLNSPEVASHYWEHAALFLEGEIYHGKENIQKRLAEFSKKNQEAHEYLSIKLIPHQKKNFFEMGVYSTEKGLYCSITGWKQVEENWVREIDIIFKHDDEQSKELTKTPNEARKKWVELSNAHDHNILVKEVYTPDAIYINQGKVDQGANQITDRYSYMSNPNWKIQLFPLQTLSVQSNITFEIGKYVSNGKGHYVIIWEKQKNGKWQACLDFNF